MYPLRISSAVLLISSFIGAMAAAMSSAHFPLSLVSIADNDSVRLEIVCFNDAISVATVSYWSRVANVADAKSLVFCICPSI